MFRVSLCTYTWLTRTSRPSFSFSPANTPHLISHYNKQIEFCIGFIFCFFGGVYPTLFAAVQAAENGGRKTVVEAIKDLANEAMIIVEESKKDDEKDEDKDGKKDVTEASAKEYLQRKTLLVLKKMNPDKVRTGEGSSARDGMS